MPSSSLVTTLSFILWFSLSLASASEEVVKDRNGDPLVLSQQYYITSAIWGAGGGGVRPEKTGKPSLCSYSIIQESLDLNKGAPVKFHIVKGTSSDEIYAGSTQLQLEFVKKPNCAESSKWAVAVQGSGSSPSARLVIGGAQDHPDSLFLSGVFQIEHLSNVFYKLVFCHQRKSVGSSSHCHDVGISLNEGRRDLVLREKNSEYGAFIVVFEKAEPVKGKFSII